MATETTQNELIDAEINYINIDNQPILKKRNLKYDTVAYIIALETELRDYYSKMCNSKIITEKFNANITLGGLLKELEKNSVFKNPVIDFYKKNLLNLRNSSLHVHTDKEVFVDFEKLKEVRKNIMNDLLNKFIKAFDNLKNKEDNTLKTSIINAKMTNKGKTFDSSIKKYKNFKGFYGCILEDTSGVEIGAVTKLIMKLESSIILYVKIVL